jgi:hypothetical protein
LSAEYPLPIPRIGITTLDANDPLTGEELIVEADIAMYDAKSEGRDRYAIFDRAKNQRGAASKSRSWHQRLRNAIDNNLFVLHAGVVHGFAGQVHGEAEVVSGGGVVVQQLDGIAKDPSATLDALVLIEEPPSTEEGGSNTLRRWRRRELNPRPRSRKGWRLRA